MLDKDLRVQTGSRAFYEVFGAAPADTVGRLLHELGERRWDLPDLRRLLEKVLRDDVAIVDYEVEHEGEPHGSRSRRSASPPRASRWPPARRTPREAPATPPSARSRPTHGSC